MNNSYNKIYIIINNYKRKDTCSILYTFKTKTKTKTLYSSDQLYDLIKNRLYNDIPDLYITNILNDIYPNDLFNYCQFNTSDDFLCMIINIGSVNNNLLLRNHKLITISID